MEAAARKLLDQGVKEAVLVKRGSKGSLLVSAGSTVGQGIFRTEQVGAFGHSHSWLKSCGLLACPSRICWVYLLLCQERPTSSVMLPYFDGSLCWLPLSMGAGGIWSMGHSSAAL